MYNLFRYDNKIFEILEKVINIVILNFLCILFSIPIITIGASVTSTYSVTMKIVRDEEIYILREFIMNLKLNFKTSTIVWILIMIFGGVLVLDFHILNLISSIVISNLLKFILTVVTIMFVFNITYIFPIISKFDNTILL